MRLASRYTTDGVILKSVAITMTTNTSATGLPHGFSQSEFALTQQRATRKWN